MKKRYVLKNKKRFYTVMMLLMISIFTSVFASNVQGYREPKTSTITVQSGDSLWSIALKYKEKGDIRKYIYDIKKLNNLDNSNIYAGQEIIIPE